MNDETLRQAQATNDRIDDLTPGRLLAAAQEVLARKPLTRLVRVAATGNLAILDKYTDEQLGYIDLSDGQVFFDPHATRTDRGGG